jgi:hypothetical protein
MNINRKLQLAAVAVIANGALALCLLAPGSAFAASCAGGRFVCGVGICNNANELFACLRATPPGCKLVNFAGCDNRGCEFCYYTAQ